MPRSLAKRKPPAHRRGDGPSASELVYAKIKADIVSFAFLPSERLVEAELCERYDVSRTPVRDALRRLENDRLVIRRDKGGRFVRSLDIAAYADVYDVRLALEQLAVERASTRAANVDLRELLEDWREGFPVHETPLDGSYITADEQFHLAIAKATGNTYLLDSLKRINDQIRVIRSFDFSIRQRIVDSEEQHLAIGQAIGAGDGERARVLMTEHITQSAEQLREIGMRIISSLYSAHERRPAGSALPVDDA